jgi:hypothetical protein
MHRRLFAATKYISQYIRACGFVKAQHHGPGPICMI